MRPSASFDTDVCIVGAGVAGLVLARTLAEQSDLKVVVVESGGASEDAARAAPLNAVEHARRHHDGAHNGRARCLGGTSTLWGGQLLPLQAQDFLGAAGTDSAWPFGEEELAPLYPEALGMFDVECAEFVRAALPPGFGSQPIAALGEFEPRYALWPAFPKRNLWKQLGAKLAIHPNVRIVPETHFTGWEVDRGNARIRAIDCRSSDGESVRIGAKRFVLASGCIESVRQLLLLDRETAHRVIAPGAGLGAGFQEHLSAEAFRVQPLDRMRFNRLFGHVFHGGTMRTLRFERRLSAGSDGGAGFFHLTYAFPADSGFELAKSYLRELQRSGKIIPNRTQLASVAGCVGDLMHMAWWRYVHSRLWFAPGARFALTIDIEQHIDSANRIELGLSEDAFGVPRARLNWGVSPRDAASFAQLAGRIHELWTNSGLAEVARLAPVGDCEEHADALAERFIASARDTYHPSGGARMGSNPRQSVVDRHLRVHGTANLHVASTAVFPGSGSANPTFTLIALAIRLGRHLAGTARVAPPEAEEPQVAAA